MIKQYLDNNEEHFTEEAISIQKDVVFIDDIYVELDALRNIISKYMLTVGPTLFKRKDTKQHISNIDKILSKRFNINIKHVYSDTLYAALPLLPDSDTGVRSNVKNIKTDLSNMIENCDKNTDCTISDDIISFDTMNGVSTAALSLIENSNDVLNKISKKGIIIDRKNAIIKGFDSKLPMYLLVDFLLIIKDYELTNKEIVAVMMHEMGHIYTHVEYMYTKTKLDIRNAENVRETILSSNGDNVSEVALKLSEKATEGLIELNKANKLYHTNSEELADAFAVRFGLGGDLATGLKKVEDIYFQITTSVNTIISTYIAILILVTGTPVVGVLMYFIMGKLFSTLYTSKDGIGTTYDNNKDRYRRIRNGIINLVRSKQVDNLQAVLNQLDDVQTILDTMRDKTIIEKISDRMPWFKSSTEYHAMERNLEDLLDNRLHIKAIR